MLVCGDGRLGGDELLAHKWTQQEVSPEEGSLRAGPDLSLPASRTEKRKRSMVMTPHNPFPIFGSFLKQPELARTSIMKIFQGSFCEHLFLFFLVKNLRECFPGGTVVGNLPANAGNPVQSCSGNIPHATEQLNPCITTAEPEASTNYCNQCA